MNDAKCVSSRLPNLAILGLWLRNACHNTSNLHKKTDSHPQFDPKKHFDPKKQPDSNKPSDPKRQSGSKKNSDVKTVAKEKTRVSEGAFNITSTTSKKDRPIMTSTHRDFFPTNSPTISYIASPTVTNLQIVMETKSVPIRNSSTSSINVDNPSRLFAPVAPTDTAAAVPAHHGLTESKLTAAIVVPIAILSLVSPALIVWFLSYRRRRKSTRDSRQSFFKPESPVISQTPFIRPPRNVKSRPRTFPPTQSTPGIIAEHHLPTRRPRSVHQFRTSQTNNHCISGFNFGFSRNSTTQASKTRRSGTKIWDTPPPYVFPRSTVAQPHIPPPAQSPQSAGPLAHIANAVSTLSPTVPTPIPTTYSPFPRPKTYRQESARSPSSPPPQIYTIPPTPSLTISLSASNLSMHNASNLQYPFSQPATDAVSDISGLSYDQDLWIATQRAGGAGLENQESHDDDSNSEVTVFEHHPGRSVMPYQMV